MGTEGFSPVEHGAGGWANAGPAPAIDPSRQLAHSRTGSASPATSLNGQTLPSEFDNFDARFPVYNAPSHWDPLIGHASDVAARTPLVAGLNPSPQELEVLISKFHLDTQRDLIRDFSKVSPLL